MENNKRYEDENILLYFKDGIVVAVYKKGCILTSKVLDTGVLKRIELCDGKSYPTVADASRVKYWTLASQKSSIREREFELVTYGAVIINSTAIMVAWNYAMKIFKPPVPVKVFTDLDKAIEWLKSKEK